MDSNFDPRAYISDSTQTSSSFDPIAYLSGKKNVDFSRVAKNALRSALGTVSPESSYDAAIKSADPEIQKTISNVAPAAGASIGSAFLPGAGTAIGGGVGEAIREMSDIARGEPSPSPLRAGLQVGGSALMSGLPETEGAIDALKNVAQSQGRRALGYTKRFFSKSPEQLPKANAVAQTMLDEGVIKPFSGAGATMDRAIDAGQTAGKTVGKTIELFDRSNYNAIKANDLISEVKKQLSPKYSGGVYSSDASVVKEIEDTIKAHTDPKGFIGFQSAQDLKEKLAEIGKFVPGSDNLRQKLFQRATGITRKALEGEIEAVDKFGSVGQKAMLPDYKKAKDIYGKAEQAISALTNRISSEAGNNQFGLLDTILAAGSNNPATAIATVVSKKVLDRIGAPTLAYIANQLAKSGLSRQAANGVLQTIVAGAEGRNK